MAGQQTLNLYVEVRLLCPQPEQIKGTVMNVAVLLFMFRGIFRRAGVLMLGAKRAVFAPADVSSIKAWVETLRSSASHGPTGRLRNLETGENEVYWVEATHPARGGFALRRFYNDSKLYPRKRV